MKDENDSVDDRPADREPQGPVGGERLAEARLARQITALEIAKELHLDEHKVRALENNEFDTLGAPVFVRGYLRKYAQLVGVESNVVLEDYQQLHRTQGVPLVVKVPKKPQREFSPGPWIALVVVVLIVALVYWILVARPFEELLPAILDDDAGIADTTPAVPSPVGKPVDEPPDEPDVPATATADDEAASPVAEGSPGPPAPRDVSRVEVESDTAPPPVAEGEVRLAVTFTGDCWTEISDASGRRLYFDLGRSGATIEVSGEAPLSALFGNASNVDLEVNGSPYEIVDAVRRGRTASLQIHGN